MSQFTGTPNLQQRLDNQSDAYKAIAKAIASNLRVSMPGIIQSFDSVRQTVNVDVAIYDRIQPYLPANIPTYSPQTGDVKIPTLIDVPLLFPRGGGFSLTVPVAAGDECLVVFADMCINEWFDAGGFTNIQQVLRRHNLSDGFAILAPTSKPKALQSYSTSAIEIRTDAGDVKVSVQAGKAAVTATEIDLNGTVNLSGTVAASVGDPTFSLPIKINGVTYKLMLQT